MFDILNHVILAALGFLFLYPFWYTLVLAFSTPQQAASMGLHLWPAPISLESIKAAISYRAIGTGYLNTIFRAVVGTALNVTITILGAYVLSKKNLPLRSAFTVIVLITMFFSGGLMPAYLLIKNLGLMDSRLALILPVLTSAWNLIIARNFILMLPDSLEEAAYIDGANPPKILWYILFPLSMPIISVIALWSVVGHWNAWFDALLYIRSTDKTVLQIALRDMIRASNFDGKGKLSISLEIGNQAMIVVQSVRAAAIIISIGPIILVYPFLQKYFVKGMLVGSLKG